jgi:hypothetical protein
MPIQGAEAVMAEHTGPAELGRVYSIAKPRLGVGSHFTLDEDLIDPLFQRWGTTYSDPVLLLQDLTTINVTSDYIIVRQTKADPLAWPAPPPPLPEGVDLSIGEPSKAPRPDWLTETRLPDEP